MTDMKCAGCGNPADSMYLNVELDATGYKEVSDVWLNEQGELEHTVLDQIEEVYPDHDSAFATTYGCGYCTHEKSNFADMVKYDIPAEERYIHPEQLVIPDA